MTLTELQQSAILMRKFQDDLASYEVQFQRLKASRQHSEYEWMAEPQPHTAIHELGIQIIQVLAPLRDRIDKNIDEVTVILDSFNVPTMWKVYPPPAFGGLIKSQTPPAERVA